MAQAPSDDAAAILWPPGLSGCCWSVLDAVEGVPSRLSPPHGLHQAALQARCRLAAVVDVRRNTAFGEQSSHDCAKPTASDVTAGEGRGERVHARNTQGQLQGPPRVGSGVSMTAAVQTLSDGRLASSRRRKSRCEFVAAPHPPRPSPSRLSTRNHLWVGAGAGVGVGVGRL